jgi:hypothetical protein
MADGDRFGLEGTDIRVDGAPSSVTTDVNTTLPLIKRLIRVLVADTDLWHDPLWLVGEHHQRWRSESRVELQPAQAKQQQAQLAALVS